MNLKLLLITGLSMLLASCSIAVSYDYDRNTDFSQYRTFGFHQKGIDSLKLNDLDKNRIIRALVSQLKAKNLTEASENEADLKVNVLASSKKIVNVDNSYPYASWGWGYGWGSYYSNTSTVYTSLQGKIVIHLIDNKTNTLIWEGIADGLNVDDYNNKEGVIFNAIEKILYNYPPKDKKKSSY